MQTELTPQHIETAFNKLPLQGRIMLHLLMLQYFNVSQEEVDYIAADRPDPRMQSGAKPLVSVVSREAIDGVAARIAQYRTIVRQRRERLWLQGECLRRQVKRSETLCRIAEELLTTRFAVSADTVRDLKLRARAAIPKPMIRELDGQWEAGALEEEAYGMRRLSIEYQTLTRRLERERKRLEVSTRELETASLMPLQDHEIATIWGIPNGTLAARKVKYLQLYLEGLQSQVNGGPERNLWRESFLALSRGPVERSIASYDGLERTEEALVERLTAFATGQMPEDLESKFWPFISKSLFALQRLSAIQMELDLSIETLEEELLERVSPTKPEPPKELEEKKEIPQLDEMGEHVLRSMLGEERRF